MAFESGLSAFQEQIDRRLDYWLPSTTLEPTILHEAMRYSCLSPGKRLRPVLCMAASASVGADPWSSLDAACAIEMIHCFSLIHDDLPCIDDDDLRRGMPTCHVKFGEAAAILAGDALCALAFHVLSEAEYLPQILRDCVFELSTAMGSNGLVGGEMMDILAEGAEPNMDRLLAIHAGKTGALIAGACVMGGTIGGGSVESIRALRAYGQSVGLAFQIADDCLNETSTPEALGKSVGSDRERKKMTFPALLGLDGARNAAKKACEASMAALKQLPGDISGLEGLARYSIERLR